MTDNLSTDYTPREKIAKRVLQADQEGYEPMFEVGSLTVEFTPDFDLFAARVAHALRRRMVYRTDNGRMARGLVRYTGDLQRIHRKNADRQGALKLDHLVLDVTIIRRKTVNSSGRWVIGIRFTENLVDGDAEVVVPSPKVQEHTNKQKAMFFLSNAIIAAMDMGCKGDRLKDMLEYAVNIGYPKNWNLWVYNWRAVHEFVHNMTDRERRKLPNAVPQAKGAYGVPLLAFPFKGRLYAPRLRRKLKWRIYPVRDMAYLSQQSPQVIRPELERFYDDAIESIDIVRNEVSKPHGIATSDYVDAFSKHLSDLLAGRKTKKDGKESVYHFFNKPC